MRTFNTFESARDTFTHISPTQQMAISRFISKTYAWMALGLLLTSAVSWMVASTPAAVEFVFSSKLVFYGLMLAQLGLVFGLTMGAQRLSRGQVLAGFFAYSGLMGVTLASIFLIYTMSSIGQLFLVASGMFGGMALLGTVTKRDLTSMGSFLMMGVWGLILVGLVNIFVASEALNLALAAVTVLIFTGLTAYDAQRIKHMAYISVTGSLSPEESAMADKGAVFAALGLYLNFINLFLSLLRLFGSRRD